MCTNTFFPFFSNHELGIMLRADDAYFLGTAIVTINNGSALWTDGRYFLQAEMQLDCNWILQKYGICIIWYYLIDKSTKMNRMLHVKNTTKVANWPPKICTCEIDFISNVIDDSGIS